MRPIVSLDVAECSDQDSRDSQARGLYRFDHVESTDSRHPIVRQEELRHFVPMPTEHQVRQTFEPLRAIPCLAYAEAVPCEYEGKHLAHLIIVLDQENVAPTVRLEPLRGARRAATDGNHSLSLPR